MLAMSRQSEHYALVSFTPTRFRCSMTAVIAAVLIASCSSGSSTSKPSNTQPQQTSSSLRPLSKASYIAAANALCQTMNTRVAALGDPGSDLTKLADTADKTAAIIAETLQKLRALSMPQGESAALNAIYAQAAGLGADYSELSSAIHSRDESAYRAAVAKINADQKAANTASNDYGLTVCGS